MKVISIFNQKGGVGKTTSVVNLAVALNYLDKKVLVVDIDPQANTTTGLGLDKYNIENSLYELFYAGEEYKITEGVEETVQTITEEKLVVEVDIEKYITTTKSGVDLIPSEAALSGLEVELVALDAIERTQQLKSIIELIDNYDYVLIDCPPSLGLLSINALCASDSIIIPVQTEYYALEGISELMNTFNLVKKQLNQDLEIEGVLLTMFDKRTYLSYEVVEEVKAYFKTKVFKVMIPRNPRLAEAPSHGLSSIEYDLKSQGAHAYIALATEIIESEGE